MKTKKALDLVFKDLTEKGFLVKTGLKYGSDFRVYTKKGEHTKFVVNVFDEKDKIKIKEIVGIVRLAQTINAWAVFAFVDSDRRITYYKLEKKGI